MEGERAAGWRRAPYKARRRENRRVDRLIQSVRWVRVTDWEANFRVRQALRAALQNDDCNVYMLSELCEVVTEFASSITSVHNESIWHGTVVGFPHVGVGFPGNGDGLRQLIAKDCISILEIELLENHPDSGALILLKLRTADVVWRSNRGTAVDTGIVHSFFTDVPSYPVPFLTDLTDLKEMRVVYRVSLNTASAHAAPTSNSNPDSVFYDVFRLTPQSIRIIRRLY
jgi:hypothetical protein